jgi:ubiquinone biosynthesis protein Coq4
MPPIVSFKYQYQYNTLLADMLAALGETTAGPSLPRLRDKMLANAEGRRILKDRPRVNTETIDLDRLSQLPEGTFGRAYVSWLERCGVTPDTRAPVCSSLFLPISVASPSCSLMQHVKIMF